MAESSAPSWDRRKALYEYIGPLSGSEMVFLALSTEKRRAQYYASIYGRVAAPYARWEFIQHWKRANAEVRK